MGTGAIAADMARVLKTLPGTTIAAVGSRTIERALDFAECVGIDTEITTLHGSYNSLIEDDSLDVVYVATPSLRHVDDTLACLKAGRAVVCEKSMAPSTADVRKVLDQASVAKLFFLHAVWSRFFPAMNKLREVIHSGVIGKVTSAHASFCQADGAGACSATLETGIYCAQFLLWVFDDAEPAVSGVVHRLHDSSGHDEHVAALLSFPCGGIGTLECSLRHASSRSATICGTKGVITVPFPFWCPTTFTVQPMDGPASQHFGEAQSHTAVLPEASADHFNFVNSQGLAYEATEVNRCLSEGLLEAPAFSSEACLRVMKVIDSIRAHWLASTE
eukprot:CAMPEP_0115850228 /NCGR_PEP_ID=MMETSP0287-20121206/11855_1 /TAXON_ID=412157 /ORGANISM="Chrysochromulina rotalis, Strain UIO044" /LENGTH=331 /DNA_ID=CAMNT_0003304217 /DNA_START=145 /DNA_END=1140 /DNA_ORIENTATION=-